MPAISSICFAVDARLCVQISSHGNLPETLCAAPANPCNGLGKKSLVLRAHSVDPLGDAGQQRQVAADVRLHVEAGDLRAEQQARTSLGTLKLTMPVSTTGLMTITCPPRRRTFISVRHQPRMVAGRIAADDEHQVGMLDVFKRDRGRAAARSN